ncbi:MAG: glutathione S-transferase family protein [Alphaproteobacteria bacterium]|nr:MAG: glutathione S-transferase family protein [Alphaproteobacteria bacterium]
MIRPLLYEHPLSPYAQKNKIALREKGVDFDLVTPDGMGSGGAGGDFVAANPRAEVPTLVDGDVSVFDSTIIQDYIEERWPLPALLPDGAAARARVRMIEEVMDTQYEAVVWGMMEVRVFGRVQGAEAEALLARAAGQIAGLNSWLEAQLGAVDWFNGADFGWGDIAVVPFVMGAVGFGVPPAPGSRLGAWLARCLARPTVAETAAEAEAAAAVVARVVPQAIASGRFQREYRDHRLEWMIRSGGLQVLVDGMKSGTIRFSSEISA